MHSSGTIARKADYIERLEPLIQKFKLENRRCLYENEDSFEIPIHYIKLIAHHLIQHCRENHQAKELKFDIQKGVKARSMQQIKLSVFVYSIEDLSETDFSKLNREMASKSHLNIGDNHIRFIKILLQGMSGSLKASSMGNTARYDMSFWVD